MKYEWTKLFPFHSTPLRVQGSRAFRSVFYFRGRDQGHDHLHHGDRDRSHGEVG